MSFTENFLPHMKVIEREANLKNKKGKKTKSIKTFIKRLIKLLIIGKNLPSNSLKFNVILKKTKSCSSKYNILNSFENNYFAIEILGASLIQYRKSNVHDQLALNYEGIGDIPYRKDGNEIHNTPKVSIYSLQNGVIVGMEGYVYDTKTNYFIRESLTFWFDWQQEIYDYYRTTTDFNSPKYLDGVTLSIVVPGGTGYYHFIIESLTKYLIFRKTYPEITINNIVVTGSSNIGFIKPWLDFLEVDSQIIFTDFDSHYACNQLLFLNTINYQYAPNSSNINLLREIIPGHANAEFRKPKIIFATRKGYSSRQLEWENELIERFDVETVDFSKLTPSEVIQCCQGCSMLIGAHGAALTNMVFCRPGTKITEITFGMNEIVYSRLAQIAGLDHVMFDQSQKNDLFAFLESKLVPINNRQ